MQYVCNISLPVLELARKCEIEHWFSFGADGWFGGRVSGVLSRDYQSFLDG